MKKNKKKIQHFCFLLVNNTQDTIIHSFLSETTKKRHFFFSVNIFSFCLEGRKD